MKNHIDIQITVPNQTRYLGLIGRIGENITRELDSFPGDRETLGHHINVVLTEATNPEGEMFENGRVCSQLGSVSHLPVAEMIDSFYQAVTDFTGSTTLQDDISIVVLKIL